MNRSLLRSYQYKLSSKIRRGIGRWLLNVDSFRSTAKDIIAMLRDYLNSLSICSIWIRFWIQQTLMNHVCCCSLKVPIWNLPLLDGDLKVDMKVWSHVVALNQNTFISPIVSKFWSGTIRSRLLSVQVLFFSPLRMKCLFLKKS